jgi:hypothetical protein
MAKIRTATYKGIPEVFTSSMLNLLNTQYFYNPQEEIDRRAGAIGRGMLGSEKREQDFAEKKYMGGPGADYVPEHWVKEEE